MGKDTFLFLIYSWELFCAISLRGNGNLWKAITVISVQTSLHTEVWGIRSVVMALRIDVMTLRIHVITSYIVVMKLCVPLITLGTATI